MTTANRQITLNNVTFSYSDLLANEDKYFGLIAAMYRGSTLTVKEGESHEQYLNRLFSHLYYKRGYRALTDAFASEHASRNVGAAIVVSPRTRQIANTQVAANEYAILNKLGIDMVKHCNKTSKIVFKSTGNQYKIRNENLDNLIEAIKENHELIHNDAEIKFGIELEFLSGFDYDSDEIDEFNDLMRETVGHSRYSCVLRYCHNKGNKWELGRDGSVRAPGMHSYELTSPVFTLNKQSDLDEIKAVVELVKTVLHGVTNKTCGTHVHMSFACYATYELMKHFAACYKANEKDLFDRLVPAHRNHNQYCRSVDPEYVLTTRYRKLNLTNVVRDSKSMHIEFRQLDGTLDYDKLMAWIKLQRLFVNTTMTNAANYTVETLKLEDVICDSTFNNAEVEKLMTMSKLAA